MNADPDDIRTYLTRWSADLAAESYEFRIALDQLEAARCDPLKIAWLLSALANAQRWQTISRDDLRKITATLEKAADGLRTLFFSQLNQALGVTTRKLEGDLTDLAKRAREVESNVS